MTEFSDLGKGREIANPSGFSDATTTPYIDGLVGAPRTLRDGVPRVKHVVGTGALETTDDAIPTTEKSAKSSGLASAKTTTDRPSDCPASHQTK